MSHTTELISNSLAIGSIATAATTAAASLCGQVEAGEPIAPVNAISHIFWGDRAADHDEASMRYTANGAALNAAAVTGWAGVHEVLFSKSPRPRTLPESMLTGAAVSALAYITDYYLVPERFTPGFEKRLSNTSLTCVYTTLAASIGIGSWLRHRR